MAIIIKRYGDQLHSRFKTAQAAFSSLNNQAQESLTSIRMIKAFGLENHQSSQFADVAADTGAKNMRVARVDARLIRPSMSLSVWQTCWPSAAVAGW